MKLVTPAASAALASLHASDPSWLDARFGALTPSSLDDVKSALGKQGVPFDEGEDAYPVLGTALLRRVAHGVLGKRRGYGDVEAALRHWELPPEMRDRLAKMKRGDGDDQTPPPPPPSTWFQALQGLKDRHGESSDALWRAVVNHPMTEYVPPRCSKCGRAFPDEHGPDAPTDEEIGLREVEPTCEERDLVRGGWYRGPRGRVVFLFSCPDCSAKTRWFRSSDALTILNPNGWGRLCGEQEDLRAALAEYLNVETRVAVPLDWDHTWSEYRRVHGRDGGSGKRGWTAVEDSARNFAARLDEGIGSWTRVVVVSGAHDGSLCGDVSGAYLRCYEDCNGSGIDNKEDGQADVRHASNMNRYRRAVDEARMDATGAKTQSRTVNGYVLEKAMISEEDATEILQRGARDFVFGLKPWWDVSVEPVDASAS